MCIYAYAYVYAYPYSRELFLEIFENWRYVNSWKRPIKA